MRIFTRACVVCVIVCVGGRGSKSNRCCGWWLAFLLQHGAGKVAGLH